METGLQEQDIITLRFSFPPLHFYLALSFTSIIHLFNMSFPFSTFVFFSLSTFLTYFSRLVPAIPFALFSCPCLPACFPYTNLPFSSSNLTSLSRPSLYPLLHVFSIATRYIISTASFTYHIQ